MKKRYSYNTLVVALARGVAEIANVTDKEGVVIDKETAQLVSNRDNLVHVAVQRVSGKYRDASESLIARKEERFVCDVLEAFRRAYC